MQLFYRKFGNKGNPPLIILHGLFGISDNWVTFGKRMAEDDGDVFADGAFEIRPWRFRFGLSLRYADFEAFVAEKSPHASYRKIVGVFEGNTLQPLEVEMG